MTSTRLIMANTLLVFALGVAHAEVINDPDDPDDAPTSQPSKPAAPVATTPKPAATPTELSWRAKTSLKLAADTRHDARSGGREENVLELYGESTLSLNYRPRKRIRIKASGQLLYRLTMRRGAESLGKLGNINRHEVEPRLQDTYLEVSTRRIDIRAGMITTVWGVNDLVNPNDVVAIRDIRNGPLVEPESIRLPTPAIQVESYLGPVSLDMVWQPQFFPHRADLFGSDFALLGPGAPGDIGQLGDLLRTVVDDSVGGLVQSAVLQTKLPRPLTDSVFGIRGSFDIGEFDVAAQYTFTFTRTPVIRIREDLLFALLPLLATPNPGGAAIASIADTLVNSPDAFEIRPRRYHHFGISLTRPVGQILLSLDTSYQHRRPVALGGDFPLRRNLNFFESAIASGVWSSTLGARYTYGESIVISAELWYELLTDIVTMDAADRPTLLMGGPHRAGLASMLQYNWRDADLSFQLVTFIEFHRFGYALTPSVNYRFNDHFTAFVGANIFGGKRGSTPAVFDPNDQVFVGLRAFL